MDTRNNALTVPWMKGFGGLADLGAETARICDLIEEEFESIEPEHES